jgi:hypothetical protein
VNHSALSERAQELKQLVIGLETFGLAAGATFSSAFFLGPGPLQRSRAWSYLSVGELPGNGHDVDTCSKRWKVSMEGSFR